MFKLYCLFLKADGQWSAKEEALLSELGRNLSSASWSDLSEHEMQKLTAEFRQRDLVNFNAVAALIDVSGLTTLDSKDKALCILNLVKLGWADGSYSENERAFVSIIAHKLEVEPEIVSEYEDTLQTIAQLSEHKAWLEQQYLPVKEAKERMDQLEADLKLLLEQSLKTAEIYGLSAEKKAQQGD
ncbi:MAG: TerB family tellurite resistance protein [Proteobacteria bacterium]|uniref:TerB family tellurite resistance protein n=1 Tax=Candidatus Avisuccinivibrio stercorigallinarum TaxID=2840704 RepID=A0A9D9DC29_9GAMM|nr:TerB family tellurite resistance protein [Candidatus Avisuccinivibrio stercorigallinarum]